MKKIIKSRIFIFLLGMLAMVGIGYGVYAINANEITYRGGTVKDALDDLYQNSGNMMGTEFVQLTNTNTYQLPKFPDGYSWVSSDSSAVQVDSNGAVTVVSSADVYLEKNNHRYFKFSFDYRGPVITLLAGKYCTVNSCATSDNNGISTNVLEKLTDGIKSRQGDYDSILIATGDRYLKFILAREVDITFSSGSYGDGGGSTGNVAKFYKLDNNNQEVLYTSFTQQNDTQDYETQHFEPGTYVLRASGGYISFSEWTIIED